MTISSAVIASTEVSTPWIWKWVEESFPNARQILARASGCRAAFAYDAERGLLFERDTVPTLPEGFDGVSHTADLALTADGRFLFATHRGHDSIAMFTVDPDTGALTLNGIEPSRGARPQNLTITPDGALLFVADTRSDRVVAFRIDLDSGRLHVGSQTEVPAPVCAVLG